MSLTFCLCTGHDISSHGIKGKESRPNCKSRGQSRNAVSNAVGLTSILNQAQFSSSFCFPLHGRLQNSASAHPRQRGSSLFDRRQVVLL